MLVVVVEDVAEEMTPGREVITNPGGCWLVIVGTSLKFTIRVCGCCRVLLKMLAMLLVLLLSTLLLADISAG